MTDEPNKHVVKFYNILWTVMKVLAIIGFVILVVWLCTT